MMDPAGRRLVVVDSLAPRGGHGSRDSVSIVLRTSAERGERARTACGSAIRKRVLRRKEVI
jgi:hypothetical protein